MTCEIWLCGLAKHQILHESKVPYTFLFVETNTRHNMDTGWEMMGQNLFKIEKYAEPINKEIEKATTVAIREEVSTQMKYILM